VFVTLTTLYLFLGRLVLDYKSVSREDKGRQSIGDPLRAAIREMLASCVQNLKNKHSTIESCLLLQCHTPNHPLPILTMYCWSLCSALKSCTSRPINHWSSAKSSGSICHTHTPDKIKALPLFALSSQPLPHSLVPLVPLVLDERSQQLEQLLHLLCGADVGHLVHDGLHQVGGQRLPALEVKQTEDISDMFQTQDGQRILQELHRHHHKLQQLSVGCLGAGHSVVGRVSW